MSSSNFNDSFAMYIRGSQANPRAAACKVFAKRAQHRHLRHVGSKQLKQECLELLQHQSDLAEDDFADFKPVCSASFEDDCISYDEPFVFADDSDADDYREDLPLVLQASLPDYLLEALEANPDALSQLSLFEVKASNSYAKAFAASIDDEGPSYF